MNGLRLRDFRPADSATLGRLFYDTIHAINPRDYTALQIDAWAPAVPAPGHWAERARTRHIIVAEHETGVLGFVELRPADSYLDCLYVRHDAQGQGVATALVRELEAHARTLGICTVGVDASITARPFFERRGYATIAPQEVEIRGVKLTNFRMEKTLTAPGAPRPG